MKNEEFLGDERESEMDVTQNESCCRVQEMYEKGEDYSFGENGVAQDYVEAVKWYLLAAKEGHVGAQYALGLCYGGGLGVEQNFEEAAKWLRMAADQGDADAQYVLGTMCCDKDSPVYDFPEGERLLLKAAGQGHEKAMELLGMSGVDLPQTNNEEPVSVDETPDWYDTIHKYIPDAKIYSNLELGRGRVRYALNADEVSVILVWPLKKGEDCDGAAQNLEAAKESLMDSTPGSFQEMVLLCEDCLPVDAGALEDRGILCLDKSQLIQFAIDYLSAENRDVRAGKLAFAKEDYDESFQCLHRWDIQDHDAQYMLGFMYYNGLGVDEDECEAVKWFRKAAENGQAEAQNGLGDCFYFGAGVAEDVEEAVMWYRKAADQGNAEAQCSLGNCLFHGEGIEQDYAEAAKWYLMAAKQNDLEAQCHLGHMYIGGQGVPKNEAEGMSWLRKSAEQGYAEAQEAYGMLLAGQLTIQELADGRKRDFTEAMEWVRRAAEQGNAEGQCSLAMAHEDGVGVRKDYCEARRWYLDAAKQGHAEAQYRLGLMCEEGKGMAVSKIEAKKWYLEAAAQGNSEAMKALDRLM